MIDIFVEMPGASAREVEERVTKPMEKLLWEIPGVEYIYSTSSPGMSMAVVRFLVGEDEEKAIVRLNQKLFANLDLIPPGASPPLVKPRSIDDVPILALTLWSKRYGDYELRRIAAQLHDTDQAGARGFGGRPDRRAAPRRCASISTKLGWPAINLSPSGVAGALGTGQPPPAGRAAFPARTGEFVLEAGSFLACADDVRSVVVGVADGRPVFRARRRPRSRTAARSRRNMSATPRPAIASCACRHARRFQAQGHQRRRRSPTTCWRA